MLLLIIKVKVNDKVKFVTILDLPVVFGSFLFFIFVPMCHSQWERSFFYVLTSYLLFNIKNVLKLYRANK